MLALISSSSFCPPVPYHLLFSVSILFPFTLLLFFLFILLLSLILPSLLLLYPFYSPHSALLLPLHPPSNHYVLYSSSLAFCSFSFPLPLLPLYPSSSPQSPPLLSLYHPSSSSSSSSSCCSLSSSCLLRFYPSSS